MRSISSSFYIAIPCLVLLLFSPLARSQAAPVYDFDPDLRNQVRTTQPGLRAELIRVMPREAANDADFRATVKTRDRHGTPRVQTRNLTLNLTKARTMLTFCLRAPLACAANAAIVATLAATGYEFIVNEDTGKTDIGLDSSPLDGTLNQMPLVRTAFEHNGSVTYFNVYEDVKPLSIIFKGHNYWTVLGPLLVTTTASSINSSDYPITTEGNILINQHGALSQGIQRYQVNYVYQNGRWQAEYEYYRTFRVPIPDSGIIVIPRPITNDQVRELIRDNPELCQYVIGSWGDCFEPLEATEDGEILPEPLPQNLPDTGSSAGSSIEDDLDMMEEEDIPLFDIDEIDLSSRFSSDFIESTSNRWLPASCPSDRIITGPNDLSIEFKYSTICQHSSMLPPLNILLASIAWFSIVFRGVLK